MPVKTNIADPTTTMPNTTNGVYGAVEKLGKQVVLLAKSRNPLNVFDKGYIETGTIWEELGIKLVSSTETPAAGTGTWTPANQKMAEFFYQFGNARRYAATLSNTDARAISVPGGVEAITEKIVASLTEGEGDEDYQSMLQVLKDPEFVAAHPAQKITTNTADLLRELRATAKLMTFANDTYYPQAAKTAGWKSSVPMEDIYVIIPVNVLEAVGIETLAKVFQMSEAEILGKIIEIDTTDNKIYVVERDAIGYYSRRRDFRILPDGSNVADEAILFVEKMYYWSALGKVKAFEYAPATA